MSFPWRTALFISLALNLIVVSAVVGAYLSGARLARPGETQAVQRLAGQRAFMRALPPEVRASLREDLVREGMDLRDERAAARQARVELFNAARAEPYDPARVRAAFAAVRAADGVLVENFHDTLSESFGRISAADRAAALDALAQQYPRGDRPPIERQGVEEGAAPGAPVVDEQTRRERRERMRERMRERREQRLQQTP